MQKFLSEQKDVKTYDVCYEWDEGVPFTDLNGGNFQLGGLWKGQRFAKPIGWWVVKRIHNDKLFYMNMDR